MSFPVLPIVAVAPIAIYFGYLRVKMHRRNRQTWEFLMTKLQPNWSGKALSEHFLWKEGLTSDPEQTWEHIQGARGLWAMFKNAGILQQMAEYAARNCDTIDTILLETLRSDAAQIRICTLNALAQYGMNRASESVRINAFRAASMYTGMTARMTQLIQDNAAMALPEFVAAM
jgi:hypothetical protein